MRGDRGHDSARTLAARRPSRQGPLPTQERPACRSLGPVRLVLASASPARRATLTNAGLDPAVEISTVDEDAELDRARSRFGPLAPADVALLLARAKAEDVAYAAAPGTPPALVLGCDSVLEFAGEILGKPESADVATARWQAMRGRSGTLHTGHWLIDTRPAQAGGSGGAVGASSATLVHFADVTDDEIAAYVATGEPLAVAGAFTIDGIGAAFVRAIEGDPGTVVGVSVPLLRELVGELGVGWFDVLADADPA